MTIPESRSPVLTREVVEMIRSEHLIRGGEDDEPWIISHNIALNVVCDAALRALASSEMTRKEIGDKLLAFYPPDHPNHKFSRLFASLVYSMGPRDPKAPVPEVSTDGERPRGSNE